MHKIKRLSHGHGPIKFIISCNAIISSAHFIKRKKDKEKVEAIYYDCMYCRQQTGTSYRQKVEGVGALNIYKLALIIYDFRKFPQKTFSVCINVLQMMPIGQLVSHSINMAIGRVQEISSARFIIISCCYLSSTNKTTTAPTPKKNKKNLSLITAWIF